MLLRYQNLKNPVKAMVRDVDQLGYLGAINITQREDSKIIVTINLEWPSQISETDFLEKVKNLPKAKTYNFF